MNNFRIIAATLLMAAAAVAQTAKPTSIWAMPNIWPRHRQLRAELMAAIHRGDIPAMEATCRAAILIMPDDATWHYNLACALAYREDPTEALDELEKAIDFGFRKADAIAVDKDFARIKDNPRFQTLVEKARSLAGKPFVNRPTPTPRYATAGAASPSPRQTSSGISTPACSTPCSNSTIPPLQSPSLRLPSPSQGPPHQKCHSL